METQQDAAELYRQLQTDAGATEAWAQAADHHTAHMHGPDEDAEQAAALREWSRTHQPFVWPMWLRRFGLLCLFAVGLALAVWPIGIYRQTGDGRWMAVSLAGALIVAAVYEAARRGRKVGL